MKKYKMLIVKLLCLVEIAIMIYLINLKRVNMDMTDMRLLVTFWKEYLISIIAALICFIGIKIVANNS